MLKTTPSEPGDNIVTNIDTNLQQVADSALATQVQALRNTYDPACNNKAGCYPAATGGAVVVMSTQTGAVYAMSSYPSYNPNVWVGGISQADYSALTDPTNNEPLLNRAIDGLYIPGSTFKLNTATAALQSGLWTPTQTFYDSGTYKTPGCQYNSTTCVFHNSSADESGSYNVSSALTVSSDDFFYNLGYLFYAEAAKYGATAIQDQAAQYGLGELTGIDLPGEVQGRVDSQADQQKLHAEAPKAFPNTTWYTGDNIEMAFGQGGTYITPIEQAVAYGTFANGGTRYAPQVAAAVVSPSGQVVKKFAPQVTGHVALSPSTYQALMTGFTGVVQSANGTAYGTFQGLDYPGGLAGKTGTADTVPGKEPTAWFVGFGPTANPQYVVVVRHRSGRLRRHRRCAGREVRLQLSGHAPDRSCDHPTGSEDHAGDGSHARRLPRDHPPRRRPRRRRPSPAEATRPPEHRPAGPGGPCPAPRMEGEMESLWPQIEPLLAQVTKPARYIGGELGAQQVEHGPDAVSWLLVYPDTYEVGLPNQGLQILYEILNERPDAGAERSYAPWVDMEAAMRAAEVPLFSVEGHHPAGRIRRHRVQPVSGARLHQRAQPDRPERGTGPGGRAHDRRSGGHGRRALRLQSGAVGRLRRLLRPGRRRGGRWRAQ